MYDNGEIHINPQQKLNQYNTNSNFLIFESECKNLFGQDLFSLISEVNKFIPTFLKMKDPAQKKNAIVFFLIKLGCSQEEPQCVT